MTIHVETHGHGHGRDLVLIHGWGMHGAIWGEAAAALAGGRRVHVVDLPGMGLSPALQPYTLERLAAALLEALPGPASVCGWSLGGLVALRMATLAPEQVERLVLVGATPKFVQADDWSCGMAAETFHRFADQVSEDYHATLQRFLALQAFGNASARMLLKALRARFEAGPLPDRGALRQALAILLESDLRAEVARIAQPALLLHGERDTLAPAAAAEWLAAALPNATLDVIDGASHAPFLSHPARFLAAVDAFLES